MIVALGKHVSRWIEFSTLEQDRNMTVAIWDDPGGIDAGEEVVDAQDKRDVAVTVRGWAQQPSDSEELFGGTHGGCRLSEACGGSRAQVAAS